MMEAERKLGQIEEKIHYLMILFDALQEECNVLQQELFAAKEESSRRGHKIEELQKRAELVKLAASLAKDKEMAFDMQEKMAEFTEEIDKYLSLLTK